MAILGYVSESKIFIAIGAFILLIGLQLSLPTKTLPAEKNGCGVPIVANIRGKKSQSQRSPQGTGRLTNVCCVAINGKAIEFTHYLGDDISW